MADLEAGLSQPGALARTNGRPMDDSAREDQVTTSRRRLCRQSHLNTRYAERTLWMTTC